MRSIAVAAFYKLKTQNLPLFQKILNYFTTIEPGTYSLHNLAKNLGVDDKTVAHYLSILEATGLIRTVYPYAKGHQILRKPEKVFLNNTTLNCAINSALGENLSMGLIRELFFLQSTHNAGMQVFYSTIGDYQTKEYCFEIGGKNKTSKQMKEAILPSFVVKDDILFATKKEIPRACKLNCVTAYS
jgi:hypothetical protein